jgi:hypothetical protein
MFDFPLVSCLAQCAAIIDCSTFSSSPVSPSVLYNCSNPFKNCKRVQRPRLRPASPTCHAGHCGDKGSDLVRARCQNQLGLCTRISALQSARIARESTFVQFFRALSANATALGPGPATVSWRRQEARRPDQFSRLRKAVIIQRSAVKSQLERQSEDPLMNEPPFTAYCPLPTPVSVTPDTRKLLPRRKSNASKSVTVSRFFGLILCVCVR